MDCILPKCLSLSSQILRAAGFLRLRIARTTINNTPTPSVRKAPVNKAANGRIVPTPSIFHTNRIQQTNKRVFIITQSLDPSNALKRDEVFEVLLFFFKAKPNFSI